MVLTVRTLGRLRHRHGHRHSMATGTDKATAIATRHITGTDKDMATAQTKLRPQLLPWHSYGQEHLSWPWSWTQPQHRHGQGHITDKMAMSTAMGKKALGHGHSTGAGKDTTMATATAKMPWAQPQAQRGQGHATNKAICTDTGKGTAQALALARTQVRYGS